MTVCGKNNADISGRSCTKRYEAETNRHRVWAWSPLLHFGVLKSQWLLHSPGSSIANYHCCLKSIMDSSNSRQTLRTSKDSLIASFLSPACQRLHSGVLPTVDAASVNDGLAESSAKVTGSSNEETGSNQERADKGGFRHFFKFYDNVAPSMHRGQMLYQPLPGETGWDRIKAMYSTDVYGNLGPEWRLILQGFWSGGIAGVFVGFILGGRSAAINFFDRNEGTKFHSEMAARRALQDKMTLSMGRLSLMWGWRTALFTGIYLFMVTNMSVYRGQTSILDFTFAGALTGSLWRFLQGPQAALVAGLAGSVLGLFAGGISLGIFKVAGISLEELRYWHYQAHHVRQGEVLSEIDKLDGSSKQHDPLTVHHNTLVKEREASTTETSTLVSSNGSQK